MKRESKKKVGTLILDLQNETPNTAQDAKTHFRRCHICNSVTESDGAAVRRCDKCGKVMAPFYFFDDTQVAPLSDLELKPTQMPGDRSPVRGLTAFW